MDDPQATWCPKKLAEKKYLSIRRWGGVSNFMMCASFRITPIYITSHTQRARKLTAKGGHICKLTVKNQDQVYQATWCPKKLAEKKIPEHQKMRGGEQLHDVWVVLAGYLDDAQKVDQTPDCSLDGLDMNTVYKWSWVVIMKMRWDFMQKIWDIIGGCSSATYVQL